MLPPKRRFVSLKQRLRDRMQREAWDRHHRFRFANERRLLKIMLERLLNGGRRRC